MKPVYRVVANDDDVTRILRQRLLQIDVIDELDRTSDKLELTLDDRDGDIVYPSKDVVLAVEIGYEGQTLVKQGSFTGLSVSLSGPPQQMVFHATAVDLRKSFKTKKNRGWDDVSLKDIADTIAGEYGYTAVVDDFLAAITFVHVDQVEQTDWQFLDKWVRFYDGFIKISAGHLVIGQRGGKRSVATGKLLPKIVAEFKKNLLRWDFDNTDKTRFLSVTAQWRDLSTATTKSYTAGNGLPNLFVGDVANEARAKQICDTRLKRLQRLESTANIEIIGEPMASSLAELEVKKLRDHVDGSYEITRVHHSLTRSGGFVTKLTGELPKS